MTSLDPAAFEDLLQVMRERMQGAGGIHKIDAISGALVEQVEQIHRVGLIAAVDGTDAIALTEVMSKNVYAAGVISVTATTLHTPRIAMTESHRRIPPIDRDQDLLRFLDGLDGMVDHDQSWVRTFREYCERQEALRLVIEESRSLVLVDGPLYTQNLLTQQVARRGIAAAAGQSPLAQEVARGGLLRVMQDCADRLIGFIKSLHTSKVMHLAGMALRPGEYWTIANWRDLLLDRFDRDREKLQWIRGTRSNWTRTVYRKNAKAFAFECHPDLVEIGLALIASPVACAAIVNHEIPFLLHCADRIVQARVAAAAKSRNLISTSPYYANLANERRFR